MIKTFKEFFNDCSAYYGEKIISIKNSELEETIFNLYDTDDFEINYDEETIELF